jgi:hypothetical protein
VKYDFFQVTGKGIPESYPSVSNAAAWKEQNVSKMLPPRTRQHVDYTPSPNGAIPATGANKKRKLLDEDVTSCCDGGNAESQTREMDEMLTVPPSLLSYWDSGDARKLFAPKLVYGTDCEVRNVVIDRIEKLDRVNSSAHEWRELVDGGDPDDVCSEHDIFLIRHRSIYLACALRKFLEEATRQRRWTWQLCIEHAIKLMNDIGIETYSNWRALARWHRRLAYSVKGTFMKAPEPKSRLPPLFNKNPDAMNSFKKYGVSILKELSVERMHSYVLDTLIPALMSRVENGIQECGEEGGDDGEALLVPIQRDEDTHVQHDKLSQATKDYLRSYRLSKVSMATIVRWMHATGFRYKNRSKHYFVDGHEKPETLAYRPVFTGRYLAHEVQAHRWLQVSLVASKELEAQDLVPKHCGYRYTCPVNNTEMVEYHVDTIRSGSRIDNHPLALGPYGGNVSIRRDPNKPIVMFIGQDEAIFKQFSFLCKMWVGPNGERSLLPKDEGAGVMISSFISREHGLIQAIDADTIHSINETRQGARYADEEAAMEVYGSSLKPLLSTSKSPFLTFFDYGENKDGYWDYNHMVLQFEDVVDCLKIMHPLVHFVFLFDHSSGHAKQRPDGLNASRMNKSFGGKGPTMHPTLIERETGYLGPNPRILKPGQIQNLVFAETDIGPFWMSSDDRIRNRLDQVDGDPFVVQ